MERTVAPAVLPVSEADLLAHLRMEPDEADARLAGCLKTAVAMLDGDDGELGQALISQTWQQEFISLPAVGFPLRLSLRPVSAIVSVEVQTADGVWAALPSDDAALLVADGASYVRLKSAHRTVARPALRISYTAGFGAEPEDVPEPIRQAILLLAAHFYDQRAPVVTSGAPVVMPISVDRLLAPYKIWGR